MRFTCGEVSDPYRFIQNRPRTSVTALKAMQRQRSAKVNFGEMFGLPDFRLLQQYWRKTVVGKYELDFAGFHWLDLAQTSP